MRPLLAATCPLVLGLVLVPGCGQDAEEVATSRDASTGGQGGFSVQDGSFGGFGASAGQDGAADAPADAPADAAAQDAPSTPDAPFTCDSSGSLDCSAATTSAYKCGDPPPNLAQAMKSAIQAVLAQNPSWFDYTQGAACCPVALQPMAFRDAVVAQVNANGACAKVDPNNPNIELVVKKNNKCSEQWVILTSQNVVRNPPKHQGSCVPAWL